MNQAHWIIFAFLGVVVVSLLAYSPDIKKAQVDFQAYSHADMLKGLEVKP